MTTSPTGLFIARMLALVGAGGLAFRKRARPFGYLFYCECARYGRGISSRSATAC